MAEKKSFFELLDAKRALVVGVAGSILFLGTVGFIVLGVMAVNGDLAIFNVPKRRAVTADIAVVKTPSAGSAVALPSPNVPKSDRPKVELFVMSYCPYGLQMEKAYVPAWATLKNKADIDVKFVSYAMHGLKEVEENTRQYCIESVASAKYQGYLNCFVASGDYQSCIKSTGIDSAQIDNCYNNADKKFGVMAQYNDKSKWLSGQFPIYPIYSDLNQKYGVQGSPTLVINGVQAEVGRTSEAVKEAICAAFNNPPAECGQKLSTAAYQPGFGI